MNFEIASSEVVLSWSYGEVTNALSGKPVLNSLTCPKIFGPMYQYQCLCDKPSIGESLYCKTCGVDFNIDNTAARSRFGHIQLAVPVVHVWYYKYSPNVISILLDMHSEIIESIINCELHIIAKSASNKFKVGQVISSGTYEGLWKDRTSYEVLSGGRAILELLSKVNLNECYCNNKLSNKLEFIKGFINNNISPTDLVIKVLPVMPAALRLPLAGDNDDYINSSLNALYSHIIDANNNAQLSLKPLDNNNDIDFQKYIENLKLLQQTVNELIDNSANIKSPANYNTVALKSLSELLKGKTGRFRNNLLGKRVDYSGRSVIVPGPELLFYECAIPRIMALELFKPFIYSKLMLMYKYITFEETKFILENDSRLEDELLREVIKYCPVILNRAPSLHKLSIRSFWAKLTNEKAIRLHPLACSGFNADFDGDQMAVHIPLSLEARIESVSLIMSTGNVLHPAHGGCVILPTQDMIMGLYYMSLKSSEFENICFNTYSEVHTFLALGRIALHTKVKFNFNDTIITSTPGRLLITEVFPSKCNFIYKWSDADFNKAHVFDIIESVLKTCGKQAMTKVCETLMALGFKYASQSGISFAKQDLIQAKYKNVLLRSAGLVLNELQSKLSFDHDRNLWASVLKCVHNSVNLETPYYSANQTPIQIMFNSGARGTSLQLKQLVSAKGGIVGFNGAPCKMPILKSYFEGLDLIHLFFCSYSSRRGMIDTALNTPSSGYLTRKLVEVCREWIISELDCGAKVGLHVKPILNLNFIKNRLIGRFLAEAIAYNNNVLLKANVLITEDNIAIILKYYNKYISIRSPLTCQAKAGICKLCYGIDLGSNHLIKLGSSVGVLAAQAIGEPGTQLTLRSFHGLISEKDKQDKWKLRDWVQDYLQSPYPGFVKITNLSCVHNSMGDVITSNNHCVISILNNNRIIWKKGISRGTYLMVSDNTFIAQSEILCFNCFPVNNCISLTGGHFFLKDVIYNLDFEKTVLIPTVYIKTGINVLSCIVNTYKDNKLLIKPGTKVNTFNALFCISQSKAWPIYSFSEERACKLSRLFENKMVNKDDSAIAHTRGVLKYGNATDNLKTYIVDPISVSEKPVIYYLYNGECLLDNNAIVSRGDLITPGNLSFNDYINIYGFNGFINYFINIIQEVYDAQGVNINSKHIEVILRRMTNMVTILDPGSTSLKSREDCKWQEVMNINNYINAISGKAALFLRKVIGITHICSHICSDQTSLLSNLSFQGAIKPIIKTILINKRSKLTGIKDNIILGKLPLFGNKRGIYEKSFAYKEE